MHSSQLIVLVVVCCTTMLLDTCSVFNYEPPACALWIRTPHGVVACLKVRVVDRYDLLTDLLVVSIVLPETLRWIPGTLSC